MPALFDTYSKSYSLERMTDDRPVLVPHDNRESINQASAISHRDLQLTNVIKPLVGSIFEIGCDAGHLLALAEYNGISSFGIDIDRQSVRRCVKNGINAAYGDMQLLIDPRFSDYYYSCIRQRAACCDLIAFLNFSHVEWEGENGQISKDLLFKYAARNFKYVLCSAYDADVSLLESRYSMKLVHNFSNWRRKFNRVDNIAVQYSEKLSICYLETYLCLQKLFVTLGN